MDSTSPTFGSGLNACLSHSIPITGTTVTFFCHYNQIVVNREALVKSRCHKSYWDSYKMLFHDKTDNKSSFKANTFSSYLHNFQIKFSI